MLNKKVVAILKKHYKCTEYWLGSKTGTFRGELEAMYRDIEDPWGCEAGKSSTNNKIFVDIIFDNNLHFVRVLDIGCGLGGLLNAIKVRNWGGYVLGLDVSQSAIQKAKNFYPNMNFNCHDLLQEELSDGG